MQLREIGISNGVIRCIHDRQNQPDFPEKSRRHAPNSPKPYSASCVVPFRSSTGDKEILSRLVCFPKWLSRPATLKMSIALSSPSCACACKAVFFFRWGISVTVIRPKELKNFPSFFRFRTFFDRIDLIFFGHLKKSQ